MSNEGESPPVLNPIAINCIEATILLAIQLIFTDASSCSGINLKELITFLILSIGKPKSLKIEPLKICDYVFGFVCLFICTCNNFLKWEVLNQRKK